MGVEVAQPQTLNTILNYHLEVERGGAAEWCPGTVGDKRRPHEHKEAVIANVRGHEGDFSLDKQGFEWGHFDTTVTGLDEEEDLSGKYYSDVVAHMKKSTGATTVIPVVHIARRKVWEEVAAAEKEMDDKAPVTAPSYNRSVHIDQSYLGAELVLENTLRTLPDTQAEKLRNGRWAIINLWRPLNTVTRDNLAVCDAATADEDDLVALFAELPESLRKAKSGYNFAAGAKSGAWEVKANPKHKWYYCGEMKPDEALLIKQFDSKLHGVARRTPHCAFSAKEDCGPTRLSIEVRCLVFWEDQPRE